MCARLVAKNRSGADRMTSYWDEWAKRFGPETQEALKNAVTHAKARQAWVTVAREEADLVLTIRDDGSGFDLAKARGRGLGLISLEERVRHVGGRLVIDTEPQRGTTIRLMVPLS